MGEEDRSISEPSVEHSPLIKLGSQVDRQHPAVVAARSIVDQAVSRQEMSAIAQSDQAAAERDQAVHRLGTAVEDLSTQLNDRTPLDRAIRRLHESWWREKQPLNGQQIDTEWTTATSCVAELRALLGD